MKTFVGVVMGLLAMSLQAAEKPNIILVYVDDLARGDLGAYGCPDIPTPHIDALADSGVKLMNYYTAAAACCPSRYALLTGVYPQREGKYAMNRGQAVPAGRPILAKTLGDAGYMTCVVGTEKWDIGNSVQGPLDLGFDEAALSVPRSTTKIDRSTGGGLNYIGVDGSYLTEIQGDAIVDFIQRGSVSDKPFFLYYTPLAVHCPLTDVPQRYLDRVPATIEKRGGRRDGKPTAKNYRRYLAATLIALDDQIGRIADCLRESGEAANTLIILASDNGGNTYDGCRPDPYRGGKHNIHPQWNGYLHLPAILKWPGVLPAGEESDGMIFSLDLYPTCAAVAGAAMPQPQDGKNILPLLTGAEVADPDRSFVWELHPGARTTGDPGNTNLKAVRWKNWRIVNFENGGWRLYDIEKDPAEKKDISAAYPEVMKAMLSRFDSWRSQMAEPKRHNSRSPRIPYGFGMMTSDEWQTVKDQPELWKQEAVREKYLSVKGK